MKRRAFIKHSAVAAGVLMISPSLLTSRLHAESVGEEGIEIPFQSAYDAITAKKEVVAAGGMMVLTIPERPESGNVVPVEVEVKSPMTQDDYIKTIYVLTTKNKANKVITANYTPAMGMAYLYVNAKLGGSQEIVVLAETNKGKIYKASQKIEVALGGCG